VNIQILELAEDDLVEGYWFYEKQQEGLGSYFRASLIADIESLRFFAGIHPKSYKGYFRLLANRFPFAVFYTVEGEEVFIRAVLDCRKNPGWLRQRLSVDEV
jgi:hypothetical protein